MSIATITQDSIPETIILHSQENRTVKETICDINNNTLYSLPQEVPSSPSLLEVLPNGEPVWIDASSLIGNPNALISINPLIPPIAGSVVVYTGDASNLDVNSQEILVVDTITNAVKINDANSSEFTTIETNEATYIKHNGGSSGLVLDAGLGDMTLTNTKLSGVVNVNSFSGLQFNGVGLINNAGSDLRIFNTDGDTIIESKTNNVKLVSNDLKYLNLITGADYSVIPIAQPADNSIVQYQSNGECAFIPTPSGGGGAGGLVNTDYLNDAPTGSIFLFNGTNGTDGNPSNTVSVDSNGLRLYGANIDIVSVVGCDTSLTQSNDCNFTINNNSAGNINLTCGGTVKITGNNGLIINETASLVNTGDTLSISSPNIILNSTTKSVILDELNNKLTINNNNGASLTELISPNVDIYTSSFKLRSQSNLNNYTLPNPDIAPNDGDIISFSGGVGSFVAPTIPNITRSFYVSKDGSDTNNGSAVAPYLTIIKALTEIASLPEDQKKTIYLSNGTYDETFSIVSNNVSIVGASAVPQQTTINGVVSFPLDISGTKINASLFGLTINGVDFSSVSDKDASFVVGACVIGSVAGIIPFNVLYTGLGVRDFTLNNNVIYGVDLSTVFINKGTINATACLFTQTTTDNIEPVVGVDGSGVLNLFGCVVLSLNATASAAPVLRFTNNVISSCQFNSSTIGYAFGTTDTQVVKTKVCVACSNSAQLTLNIFNNKFDGTGSRIAYVGVNYVIISKASGGNLIINYGQNIGTVLSGGVHHLPVTGGVTRNQFLTII